MKYFIIMLLVLTMLVIPYSINDKAPLLITGLSLLTIMGIVLKMSGSEFVLVAIALCIPDGWASTNIEFTEVNNMRHAFGRMGYYALPLIGFILVRIGSFYKNRQVLYNMLSLIFVGLVSVAVTESFSDFSRMLTVIGTGYAFMLICYADYKIKINDAFLFLDVLFFISLFYGISEFFFRQSPYQFITDATVNIDYIARARGILGHPLYLSGLALFYQAVLYVRSMINKKVYIIQQMACILMALIVVSRTTIVVMLIQYVIYLYMSGSYKNMKVMVANVVALFIGGLLIFRFADSLILDIITRFLEGNADHRASAFGTVFMLFLDNPLGVGFSNIMDSIAKGGYNKEGFIADFTTVDNLFLSQLAAYGVFSFFTIKYYFYFLYDAFRYRRRRPMLFRYILTLYFPFLFEAFSFDWETSPFLCLLLFGFIGYLYRYCQENYECKTISNYSHL